MDLPEPMIYSSIRQTYKAPSPCQSNDPLQFGRSRLLQALPLRRNPPAWSNKPFHRSDCNPKQRLACAVIFIRLFLPSACSFLMTVCTSICVELLCLLFFIIITEKKGFIRCYGAGSLIRIQVMETSRIQHIRSHFKNSLAFYGKTFQNDTVNKNTDKVHDDERYGF